MLNTITNKMIIKQIFLATLLFSEKRITSGKKDTSQRNNEEFKDKFWTPNSIDLVKTTTEFDRYKIHQLNIVSRDQPAFPNDFHPEKDLTSLTLINDKGWTPITKAVATGQVDVIRKFLKSEEGRALLEVQDGGGWNAMTKAGSTGQVNVIREFLKTGEGRVLLTIQDGGGRNAMTMAGLKGHIGVAVIPAIIGLLPIPTLQERQHFVNILNLLCNRLLRHVRHYISKIESLKI